MPENRSDKTTQTESKLDGKILIVDDNEDILIAGKLLLKRKFSVIKTCNHPQLIPTLIENTQFDAILLDMNFGPGESTGEQGFYWLNKIKETSPQSIIIMITAHGDINIAVEAMKMGATDFIAKPWQNEKVIATLSSAVRLSKIQKEASLLRGQNQTLLHANSQQYQIIGNSQALKHVQSLVSRCAPTEANVLILGENGTGKELTAREIHQKSRRSDQIFVSIDLGAISENLFESELFGHKKGAFTGANEDRVGKIKAADGGTLFLDEIGNLPLHLQAKLLTVLAQRTITPLGANRTEPFNVRIVAATNLSFIKLHDETVFRQDLLFRLNTVEIELPPLRARREDIVTIAQHFLALYCKKYASTEKSFAESTIAAMKHYHWPGNIRALRHAIERAVILSESAIIQVHDIGLNQAESNSATSENVHSQDHSLLSSSNTSNTADNVNAQVMIKANNITINDLNLERIEKETITQALRKHKYNISHSAKELGLTRAALYRRMEKHGL